MRMKYVNTLKDQTTVNPGKLPTILYIAENNIDPTDHSLCKFEHQKPPEIQVVFDSISIGNHVEKATFLIPKPGSFWQILILFWHSKSVRMRSYKSPILDIRALEALL